MSRRRAAVVVVAAVILALAVPGRARAGELSWSGTLYYVDTPQFDGGVAHDVVVDRVGDWYRLTDTGTEIVRTGLTPCLDVGPNEVRCLAEYVSDVVAFLGDAGDVLTIDADLSVIACGGGGADVLTGGPAGDLLDGGPGPDDVRGGAGDDGLIDLRGTFRDPACGHGDPTPLGDRYYGGPGTDRVEGGPGRDIISGGDDTDLLFGFEGEDRLEGGDGLDLLFGMDGNDELDGGADRDELYGGLGDDRVYGGPGDDFLGWTVRVMPHVVDAPTVVTEADEGNDRLDGGEGDDAFAAGPGERVHDFEDLSTIAGDSIDRTLLSARLNGADHYIGGPGADDVSYINRDVPVHVSLDGLANDGALGEADEVDPDVELVVGGARDDVLVAAAEGSSLRGDFGDDVLLGGSSRDTLAGGDGADRLAGDAGDDDLGGGADADQLDGGDGRDLLLGGAGDDAVAGARGSDTLEGGPGADVLDGGDGPDCLSGFLLPADPVPGSTCRSSGSPTTSAGADGSDVLYGGAGRDRLDGGPGEDVADYSHLREPVVVALPGAPAGAAAAFGRSADTDDIAGDVEAARGGRGDDTLIGNAADNLLDGGPGDDQLAGLGGSDQLRGGSGSDLLDARDGEPDAVRCGTQRDLALIDEDDEVISGLADACEAPDAGRGLAGLPLIAPAGQCSLPVRLPGVARRFLLGGQASVFWGSIVDASRCPAAVGGGPRRGAARLSGATVRLGRRGSDVVARMLGGRPAVCGRRVVATRRLEVQRAPRGFVTRGRTLLAQGAGASWRMIDGCRRTRVQTIQGRVRVARPRGASATPVMPG